MTDNSTAQNSEFFISDVIDKHPVNLQQLLFIGLCLILNMIDGFDITAMAVTASAIGHELSLSEDKLGLAFSFALAGMTIGAMFLASIADVIGRRKVIIISMLGIGTTVLCTGLVDSLWGLVLLRFMSGLGAGAMLASVATLTSEYSSQKYRPLAVAAVTAGFPLGAVITGLVGGDIMSEFGWRGVFFLGGGATLFLSIIAYFQLPESLQFLVKKQPSNALQRANRILMRLHRRPLANLPTIEVESSPHGDGIFSNMLTLMTPTHRSSTLRLWFTFFLCFCTLYFLMSWIPNLIINSGYPEQTAHYAFSLFNLGSVLGIFILGTLATRLKLTNLVCFFLILSAVSMVIFALLPARESLLFSLVFLIGLMMAGGFSGLCIVATKIYPTEIRSTGVGWALGLGRFGAILGPSVGGLLIASGLSMAGNFYLFAIPVMASGIMAYWLRVD